MNGDKPAVSVEPPNTTTAAPDQTTEPPMAGPGMSSLLQGKVRPNVFSQAQPTPPAAQTKPLIPTGYYFAADVVLVTVALLLVFKGTGVTWKELLFAGTLVAAGGVLAAIGVLQRNKQ
jgi:hypothetical protein